MDEIKRILAPTDLSAFSAKGLVYAANLAKALAAQVIVCHVVRTEMDAKKGDRLIFTWTGGTEKS